MVRILSMSLYLLIVSASFTQAQEPSATSASRERRATLNYEDELVEGGTHKPELSYLFQKKNFNYGKLIKLRENFIPEMRRTTEDLQRIRGGN